MCHYTEDRFICNHIVCLWTYSAYHRHKNHNSSFKENLLLIPNTNRCVVRGKYLNLYKEVFSALVYDAAIRQIDISYKPIDELVLNDLKDQWQSQHFNWQSLFLKYRRFCKRLDFALYYQDQLIALLYGKTSRSRRVLRIDYVEATSREVRPPELSVVADLVLATVEAIGQYMDSEYVALRNPLNESVIRHYSKYQYSLEVNFDGSRTKTMYKKIR